MRVTVQRQAPLRVDSVPCLAGRIGMTFAPGRWQPHSRSGPHDRDLAGDLLAISNWGATTVVTLMPGPELRRCRMWNMREHVEGMGMAWEHYPITDVSVPSRGMQTRWPRLSARLRQRLAEGEDVLVHCRGGLGRAGMVTARLLVEAGEHKPAAAIRAVRRARPGAVETKQQEAWVASNGWRQ